MLRRASIIVIIDAVACAAPAASPVASELSTKSPPVGTREAKAQIASAPTPARTCDGDAFGLEENVESDVAARFAKRRGTMGRAAKQMVVTSHPLATEAALAVLRTGGTAADAFVAAALVEDVVLPGVTSTAGLTGALVYEAKTKKVTYVHGGLADPLDVERRYEATDTAAGKMVLVPGAPAAYAELARRFGKRPFAALVEPAAKLATSGFQVDALYARSIAAHQQKLSKSDYGKKAFFRDGRPIVEGETIKLEEFGATLRSFGKNPRWFHSGPWAKAAVTLANANGGRLEARDFENYRVEVAAPIHGHYMGYDVYAAGHGGLKALVSLEAFEALRAGAPPASPLASADALEMLLRVQREVTVLPALADRALVSRGSSLDALLPELASDIAGRVRARAARKLPATPVGTHSSAVVVVDANGDVVAGTHTIETLNWGEGLFVGGIPLSTAGPNGFDDPTKATLPMRVDPLSSTIALKDGAPVLALSIYGTGLHPGDVQVLDAVLGRGLDAEDAVLEPRVGYFAYDHATGSIDYAKNSVDPRFPADLLCTLQARGFRLERSMPGARGGFVDTGFPTLVTLTKDGLHGMPPDAYFIHGSAAGD